jgi:hypothetical protein
MESLMPPPAASTTDFDLKGLTEVWEERIEEGYASEDPRSASGPRWIQRILSLVFGHKERKKARHFVIDRTPNRQQALDLLQTLQGSQAADTLAKLAELHTLSVKLEELFQKIISAGDRDPSVKALGETLLHLHALLGESQPVETDILNVWTEIENCLRRWLALSETPKSPRRKGFWK